MLCEDVDLVEKKRERERERKRWDRASISAVEEDPSQLEISNQEERVLPLYYYETLTSLILSHLSGIRLDAH